MEKVKLTVKQARDLETTTKSAGTVEHHIENGWKLSNQSLNDLSSDELIRAI